MNMNSGCPTEMRKGQTNLQINVSNPSREACSVSYISRMLHVSLQSISIVQLDDDRCWIRATAAFHIRNSRIVQDPYATPTPAFFNLVAELSCSQARSDQHRASESGNRAKAMAAPSSVRGIAHAF
jgi:hypothetical protein